MCGSPENLLGVKRHFRFDQDQFVHGCRQMIECAHCGRTSELPEPEALSHGCEPDVQRENLEALAIAFRKAWRFISRDWYPRRRTRVVQIR